MTRSSAAAVTLPITNVARKYGYIIWHKKHDAAMRAVLGQDEVTDLQFPGSLQKRKSIDWKRRRISITYRLTRELPQHIKGVRLQRQGARVLVDFE
jgi:hypothetical protein